MDCIKCGTENLRDYPVCDNCAETAHFSYRNDCRCRQCQEEYMPNILSFDEDLHAARNGYGVDDNEELWGMPPAYSDEEIAAMAAMMAWSEAMLSEIGRQLIDEE